MKDQRFNVCPNIRDKDWVVDYEVSVDVLTSEIAFAASFNKGNIKKDLEFISCTVFELASVVRNKDFDEIKSKRELLSNIYEKYSSRFDDFVLPLGSQSAASIYRLRSWTNNIVRMISKNEFKDKNLFECFSILSNVFHAMYISILKEAK